MLWATDSRSVAGHLEWAPGWYMGIMEKTYAVDEIVGVESGGLVSGVGRQRGPRLETEELTHKARTIFSFNIW